MEIGPSRALSNMSATIPREETHYFYDAPRFSMPPALKFHLLPNPSQFTAQPSSTLKPIRSKREEFIQSYVCCWKKIQLRYLLGKMAKTRAVSFIWQLGCNGRNGSKFYYIAITNNTYIWTTMFLQTTAVWVSEKHCLQLGSKIQRKHKFF